MRRFLIILGLCSLAWQAAAQDARQMQNYEAQMKAAQEYMNNNPQLKQQIQQMQQQGAPGMQPMDGKALEGVMAMNRCMQDEIGADGLERMRVSGQEMGGKVKALCQEGKRDQAQHAQQEYAMQMRQTQEYKGMRLCAERYKDLMSDPAFANIRRSMDSMQPGQAKKHVCD